MMEVVQSINRFKKWIIEDWPLIGNSDFNLERGPGEMPDAMSFL